MRRFARITVVVSALSLGLTLSGCGNFDPTDIFNAEMFNTKKKLPGERKPVFPEGTPGVSQGVPQELVKGYQPPIEPEPAVAQPEEAKAKPKPKPKPKVVARPAPPPDEPPPESARPEGARPEGARSPLQSRWPDPPQQQQQPSQQQGGRVAWPDPPASGTFSR